HGAAMQMANLDLRARQHVIAGGVRGPAVEPGNLEQSWLWKLASHEGKPAMPPGGKLADEDLETLRRWILAGAPYPETAAVDEETARRVALRQLEERAVTAQERQ